MANREDEDRWKKKYQLAIREFGNTEQTLQQRLELLQHGLAKIAVAAQGQDNGLDSALSTLRKNLRKESFDASIPVQIEALEARIVQFDVGRIKRGVAALNVIAEVLDQLLSIVSEKKDKQAIERLVKAIKHDKRKYEKSLLEPNKLDNYLQQLSAIHSNAVASIRDQSPEGRNGFFDRLFTRNTAAMVVVDTEDKDIILGDDLAPVVSLTASELQEAVAQKAGATDLKKSVHELSDEVPSDNDRINDSENENSANIDKAQSTLLQPITEGGFAEQSDDELTAVSAEVVAILLELVAEMEVPEAVQDLAQALYQDLQEGMTWQELVPTLDRVVTVVTATLSRDQEEFEQFLQSLDQRLVSVNAFLGFIDAQQRELSQQASLLDSTVKTEVGEIRDEMAASVNAASADVPALKARIDGRLEDIEGALSSFKQFQADEQSSLKTQLNEMALRINELEQESKLAQENLATQREKLLRDVLTELPNREAYNIRLAQEYDRLQRYQRPLVMAVADIDWFKKINDNYGHSAGDKVLKIIARTLQKNLRKLDFIARFGGEEFVILLPEASMDSAVLAIEKLRGAVEACPFRFRDEPLVITASFGVAQYREGDTPELVFDRADKALYRAKEAGRNKIERG